MNKAERAAYARKWRAKHRDKVRAYDRKRGKTQKRKEQNAASRERNKEKILLKAKERYRNNRDKALAYAIEKYWRERDAILAASRERRKRLGYKEREREQYAANPEPKRKVAARWYRANKGKAKAISSRYRARKKNAHGDVTKRDFDFLWSVFDKECIKCGATDRLGWDHIIPLALGGPHQPTNLQPLCCSCNPSKGARSRADYRTKHQKKLIFNEYQLNLFGE